MRIGFNPQKDRLLEPSPYFHQVVLPVYLPHGDDYFKDGLEILRLCLSSLFKTCHDRTYITVVNNGSCAEVQAYLESLFAAGRLQEIVHCTNIGYINAMLKGVTGHTFQWVTTSDSDVLFLPGWQEATYQVFAGFPKAGAVSPVPNSRMLRSMTGNVLCERAASPTLQFRPVREPAAMRDFAVSIGRADLFNEVHLAKYLTIDNGQVEAMVGAGHFVVTYRSDIFDSMAQRATRFVMGGDSDNLFDQPVIEKGYWRLSTTGNFAHHMGNTLEPWMRPRFDRIEDTPRHYEVAPTLHRPRQWRITNWVNQRILSRLLFKDRVWRLFLRAKGLTQGEAMRY